MSIRYMHRHTHIPHCMYKQCTCSNSSNTSAARVICSPRACVVRNLKILWPWLVFQRRNCSVYNQESSLLFSFVSFYPSPSSRVFAYSSFHLPFMSRLDFSFSLFLLKCILINGEIQGCLSKSLLAMNAAEVFLRAAVLIWHNYRNTVGRSSKALIHNQKYEPWWQKTTNTTQHQVALPVIVHQQTEDEILPTHCTHVFFFHMCTHPYQSCRCNLLERRLTLRCQVCFHGYTGIQSTSQLSLLLVLKPKHVGSGDASGPAAPKAKKKNTNRKNEAPIMCLFIQVISDFQFPNLVGQTAI